MSCGEPTIIDGGVWDRFGFPYPHECPVILYVPNESDFCPVCGGLSIGGGGACDDCRKLPLKKAVRMIKRVTRPVSEGLDL